MSAADEIVHYFDVKKGGSRFAGLYNDAHGPGLKVHLIQQPSQLRYLPSQLQRLLYYKPDHINPAWEYRAPPDKPIQGLGDLDVRLQQLDPGYKEYVRQEWGPDSHHAKQAAFDFAHVFSPKRKTPKRTKSFSPAKKKKSASPKRKSPKRTKSAHK